MIVLFLIVPNSMYCRVFKYLSLSIKLKFLFKIFSHFGISKFSTLSKQQVEIIKSMEDDPLIKLTEYFKSNGFDPREAVEKAEVELERRRQHESNICLFISAFSRYVLPQILKNSFFRTTLSNTHE